MTLCYINSMKIVDHHVDLGCNIYVYTLHFVLPPCCETFKPAPAEICREQWIRGRASDSRLRELGSNPVLRC